MKRGLALASGLLAGLLLEPPDALGQVRYDGVLSGAFAGENPALDEGGVDYLVPAEEGSLVSGGRAVNLFHGFEQFDLTPDRGVVFTGDPSLGIDHLIVRVASPEGAPSSIDGSLESQIPGASLFLLDANGILIGPDGDIHADGALFVSTADFVLDDEGNRLEVRGGDFGTLLTGVPAALGFEVSGATSGPSAAPDLVVRGEMSTAGNPRPSSGGDARWDGGIHLSGRRVRISADEGRQVELRAGGEATVASSVGLVQVAAVGGAGVEVPLDLATFSPPEAGVGGDASLEIEDNVLIVPAPLENPSGWLGRVVLRGGRLTMAGEGRAIPRVAGRGGESVDPSGGLPPRPALDLAFSESVDLGPSLLVVDSRPGSPEEPVGSLRIEAPNITVGPGAQLQSRPFQQHPGGDIEIVGSRILVEDALITGTFRSACTDASSCGAVGDIVLEGDRIEVRGSLAEISASTDDLRDAGSVVIRAREQVVVDGGGSPLDGDRYPGIYARAGAGAGFEGDPNDPGQAERVAGNAGRIRVETPELLVRGGAQLSAAVFAGRGGEGGAVELEISETLAIEGSTAEGVLSQVSAESNSTVSAVGGRISIRGLGAATEGPAQIRLIDNARLSTSSTGSGPAGEIGLSAGEIELRGGAAISTESGLASNGGEAADVRLSASGDLLIREGSRISSTSNGDVAPGSIRLEAGGRLEISGGSQVLARAIREDPSDPPPGEPNPLELGNVFLSAGSEVWVSDSEILTNTRRVESGSVAIQSGNALEIFSSSIRTEVERVDGAGGDIDVSSAILVVNDSLLSADANGLSADAGNLTLSAPIALVVDAASVLSADPGQLGLAGTISVRAPDNDLFTALDVIDQSVDEPKVEIVDPCEVSRSDQGSFRAEGRRPPLRSPGRPYRWLGGTGGPTESDVQGCPGGRGDASGSR